jgi:hypothetical protein
MNADTPIPVVDDSQGHLGRRSTLVSLSAHGEHQLVLSVHLFSLKATVPAPRSQKWPHTTPGRGRHIEEGDPPRVPAAERLAKWIKQKH